MVPKSNWKRAPKNRRRRPARGASRLRARVSALLAVGFVAGMVLWLGDGFRLQGAATATLLAEAPSLAATAPAAPAPAQDAPAGDTDLVQGELGPGETLSQALRARGVELARTQEIIEALRDEFDFRFSRAGDTFSLLTARGTGALLSFEYRRGPLEVYVVSRDDNGALRSFQKEAALQTAERQTRTLRATGPFSSAFPAGDEGAALAEALWLAYGASLDLYQLPDDTTATLITEPLDGRPRVLAAVLRAPGQAPRYAFHYIDPEGHASYVDEDGDDLGGSFLKSPCKLSNLPGAPSFHKGGKDLDAPVGTPLVAVADGEITFAGPRPSEGQVVEILHQDGSRATYRAIGKIAPGIKRGVVVNQGRAIGTAGPAALGQLGFWVEQNKKRVDLSTRALGGNRIPNRHREHFGMFVREHRATLDAE